MGWKIGILVGVLVFFGVGCGEAPEKPLEREWLELEQKREQRLSDSEIFDRKIKCQDEVDKFKKRYNNTVGGYYYGLGNTCIIKSYDRDSGVFETDIQNIQDGK